MWASGEVKEAGLGVGPAVAEERPDAEPATRSPSTPQASQGPGQEESQLPGGALGLGRRLAWAPPRRLRDLCAGRTFPSLPQRASPY